jgi:hypothetical protein
MLTRFRTLSRLRGEKARLALSCSAEDAVLRCSPVATASAFLGCGNDKLTPSDVDAVLP